MSLLQLSDAPKSTDLFVWADFLELHCLNSPDNIASIDAAAKEVKSQADNGIDTELFGNSQPTNEIFYSPEADDKARRIAGEALNLCRNRLSFFGDCYPFIVDKAAKELSLKNDLSFEQKLYIALLLCSNFTNVSLNNDIFTIGFEKISKYAFKGILPPEALVLHVGTRQGEEEDSIFITSDKFIDKIQAIAEKLGLKVIADEEEFSGQNTGDGGIDLIGFIPLEESLGEEIVFLGQSATSKRRNDINKKQSDANYQKWKNWIKFNNTTGNILFTSASLRQPDGKFIQGFPRNCDAIWIDRCRVIKFISKWRARSSSNSETLIIPEEITTCIDKLTA